MRHEDIAKVSTCPCHFHHDKENAGRLRTDLPSPDGTVHEHEHSHEHVHDGRPHVHMPDGTVRYLEEGELPSAPKRRRSSSI